MALVISSLNQLINKYPHPMKKTTLKIQGYGQRIADSPVI
jgi:hypothetical protein